MAAGEACKMRLLGTNLGNSGAAAYVEPVLSDDMLLATRGAMDLKRNNYQPLVIADIQCTAANAAAAEMSIANGVLDGTGTAVLLHVKSSDANDTDAGTGDARAIKIIGLTCSSATVANPIFTVEEVRLNGATGVATTRYYVRVLHAYCCAWGSGGDDAKGNVIVTNVAENATYLTIAAGYNESDGCAIYVPNDYSARIAYMQSIQTTQGAAGRGTRHYASPVNLDDYNAAPDVSTGDDCVSTYYQPVGEPVYSDRIYRARSSVYSGVINFFQAQIAGAETYIFRARVILYAHSAARRQLA